MKLSLPKSLGGALIVGGTSIGAGMLALPVITSLGGFLPACIIYLICWLFSLSTGLLLLEVCQWMPENANLATMATQLLGPFGKYASWVLYIFLFYTLSIAYTAGGGGFIFNFFGGHIPLFVCIPLFALIFGSFIYLGTKVVDRANSVLMTGLIVTYILFVIFGARYVNTANLTHSHFGYSLLALPVMFTSFSYQGVIPSLNAYLDHNPKLMRRAIIFGSAIPFATYIIWEYLILGIVSPEALIAAKEAGQSAVVPLSEELRGSHIGALGQFFSFFALTTSFLGVTLGLLDFLSDSLEIKKEGWRKLALCLLIFVPPVIVVWTNPSIFLTALGVAGGVGCALLLGLMPILMVWVGRYRRHFSHLHIQLRGGKPLLIILATFVALELGIELLQEIL